VNARLWLTLPLVLLISGCSILGWKSNVKPIEIQSKAVERTRLNIPDPSPLKGRSTKWIVVTPENVEEVWERLREEKVDLVLFAITDEGYEELALTMAELRNFIATQRSIIIKYREYYEPKTPDSK